VAKSVNVSLCPCPIRQRVQSKSTTLVHRSLVGTAPAYLSDVCQFTSAVIVHFQRSTDSRTVHRRAQNCNCRPSLWNAIHVGRCPAYMADCVRSVVGSATRSGLCSAESTLNVTPRLRSKFGERSFSHAGPAAWNSLRSELREVAVSTVFRNRLKTYFFNLAFK